MTYRKSSDILHDTGKCEALLASPANEGGAANRAIFLNRDGVRIEDVGYPHRQADLNIIWENIPPLITAQRCGYLLIIVTKQSGIARGYYAVEEYCEFQDSVVDRLGRVGLFIAGSYFCPYDERGSVPEYSRRSELRKPRPGMILEAVSDFNVDLGRNYVIGDRNTDRIEIGQLRSLILKGRYPLTSSRAVYRSVREVWDVIRENP